MHNKQSVYNKELLYILAREIIDLYKEKQDTSTAESLTEMSFALLRLVTENKSLELSSKDIKVWQDLFDFFDRKQYASLSEEPIEKIYAEINGYFANKDRT